MSPDPIQIRLRKPLFRIFALASLAVAFVMLPGCGEKKAGEEDDDEEVKEAAKAIRKSSAKEKIRTAKFQIQNFEQALDSYRLDVGHYPQTLQDLVINEEQAPNWNGPYMRSIPKDPWGMEYQYDREGVHNQTTFDLYSLGADNMEGGEGENADIVNWSTESYY